MDPTRKLANVTPETTTSPLPQVEVRPKKTPTVQGTKGLAPQTNYSRVNAGAPPQPDAGGAAQKSLAPMGAMMLPAKMASEGSMGTMMPVPTLQDMVKAAMAGAQSRIRLAEEAARQQAHLGEKTAEEKCSKCSKEPCECKKDKTASADSITTEYAIKLAEAIEYAAPAIKKVAEPVGQGPGALPVLEAQASKPLTENMGQAHHQPPMHPGTQKARPADASNQMENDANRAPGGSSVMVQKNVGKTAAALKKLAEEDKALEKKETEGLSEAKKGLAKAEGAHKKEDKGEEKEAASLVDYMLGLTKKAEDAINPAKISAGPAVPPETSASGESGGAPAGGMPQGPTGLVGSNESAINYNKSQAKSPVKTDMGKYLAEPALSGSTDSTLRAAFEHSSASDGNKFASAGGVTKVAAARALLAKLAETAQEKVS